MLQLLAHIQLSEWLGLAGAVASAIGWTWRIGRKLFARVDRLLVAIQTNTQQNTALQRQGNALRAQVEVLTTQVRSVSDRTDRIERNGSAPIRQVLQTVEQQVVPQLAQVATEQGRVRAELANGEGQADADHR